MQRIVIGRKGCGLPEYPAPLRRRLEEYEPVQAGWTTEERIPKDRDKMAMCPFENVRLCDPYIAKGGSVPLDWSRALLTTNRPLFTAEVGMPERSRLGSRKFASRTLGALTPRWAGS